MVSHVRDIARQTFRLGPAEPMDAGNRTERCPAAWQPTILTLRGHGRDIVRFRHRGFITSIGLIAAIDHPSHKSPHEKPTGMGFHAEWFTWARAGRLGSEGVAPRTGKALFRGPRGKTRSIDFALLPSAHTISPHDPGV